MINQNMADILATLGQHLAEIIEDDPEGVYLYAEADEGSQEAGIFKEMEEGVSYFRPDGELFDAIDRLWQAADEDEKWAVMEYAVADGRFNADFLYPDQLDPDETSHDRRERALQQRFAGKPVVYPPMDEFFHELDASDLSSDAAG